jgi:aminoglycoside phosphotransferase (APT) family kinase protein
MGLAGPGSTITGSQIPGGVSSDVWALSVDGRSICVKRPLARLRVAADWRAPLERGAREQAWLRFAAGVRPGAVPLVLGSDEVNHAFAMELLDLRRFSSWKELLLRGEMDVRAARRLGLHLAALHESSAASPTVMDTFSDQSTFKALRISPYFEAVLGRHPALRPEIATAVADVLVPRVVIHGDLSPKNVLVGDEEAVLIDAECVSVGDPAFDVAFCLTHLTLKAAHRPHWHVGYRQLAQEFVSAYCSHIAQEHVGDLLRRTGRQLGALLLARVDGKSPVEYLGQAERDVVRRLGIDVLRDPPPEPLVVMARLNELRGQSRTP